MGRAPRRWVLAAVWALLVATGAVPQQMMLDQDEGTAYIIEHGVLFRLDLRTMQVVGRKTLFRGAGPWDNRLVVSRSEDGARFSRTGVVVAAAGGVPDLAYDAQGRLVAIFQYFPDEPEEEFDRIAAAFSMDEGQSWTRPQAITISGLPPNARRAPCDPDLVLLPDGRVRLYFTCDVHGDQRGTARTLSAVSTDCVAFELEQGERFADPPNPVLDPSAIRIGGTWHLYVPRMAPGAPAYHLVSDDGLSFARAEDIRVPGVEFRGNVIAVPGGYRFYGCGQPRAATAFSPDGYAWSPEATESLPLSGDPGVVRLRDGSYLMLHTERR